MLVLCGAGCVGVGVGPWAREGAGRPLAPPRPKVRNGAEESSSYGLCVLHGFSCRCRNQKVICVAYACWPDAAASCINSPAALT